MSLRGLQRVAVEVLAERGAITRTQLAGAMRLHTGSLRNVCTAINTLADYEPPLVEESGYWLIRLTGEGAAAAQRFRTSKWQSPSGAA